MFQKKDLLHLTVFIWISLFFITLFTTYTVVILFIPKIRVHTSDTKNRETLPRLDWFSDPVNSSSAKGQWGGHRGDNVSVLNLWDITHFAKIYSPEEYSEVVNRIRGSSASSLDGDNRALIFNQWKGKMDEIRDFNGGNRHGVIHPVPDLEHVTEEYNEDECRGRLYPDDLNVSELDQLSTAIPYLKNYANPCFCDTKNSVACLPLFYVLGADQCALDVSKMMAGHPLIHSVQGRDWWHKERLSVQNNLNPATLHQYIDSYKNAALHIQHTVTRDRANHPGILGDTSPSMFYDQSLWKLIRANQQQSEPEVTTADVLHGLVPQAKLVLVLCDPSEHFYSQWLQKHKLGSPHNDTWLLYDLNESLGMFRECLSDMDIQYRDCLYSVLRGAKVEEHWNTLDRLRAGLYIDFLQDWMAIFPKKQFHILNYSDFKRNQTQVINDVFQFLEIYPLDNQKLEEVGKDLKYLHKGRPTMDQDVRDFLDNFYESHNEALAAYLKDFKYLWQAEKNKNMK